MGLLCILISLAFLKKQYYLSCIDKRKVKRGKSKNYYPISKDRKKKAISVKTSVAGVILFC